VPLKALPVIASHVLNVHQMQCFAIAVSNNLELCLAHAKIQSNITVGSQMNNLWERLLPLKVPFL